MAGKLVHFEIPAQDAKRAIDFYSSLFGWQFGDSGMPGIEYHMTQLGDAMGGAIYPSEEAGSGQLDYYDVDDINAGAARVRELGGESNDPMPIPGIGHFAHCKDTEGNRFGLFQSDESATAPN